MSDKQDLLVEIGTEELPPKALLNLISAFSKGIDDQLEKLGLSRSSIKSFATPRRLAVIVEQLDTAQQDKLVERKGPALKAAYDGEGNPTKAALGFAKSCGVEVENLEVQDTPNGSWLLHKQVQKGSSTVALIPDIVEKSLAALPIPKRMRWGSRSEEFVRPVHWVIMLYGTELVPGNVMGHTPIQETKGHRFHHPDAIRIDHPQEYETKLMEKGFVIADFHVRRQKIHSLVSLEAEKLNARAVIDEDLLNEVTALNEWPVAIMGSFDISFLEVPSECLVQAMQGHQKYFPIIDETEKLLPNFIAISNIQSLDIEQVRAGNERVIRPRFSDAAFFWQQDLKKPLEHHIESLKSLKFQDKLGSMHDKAGRIASLADVIAEALSLDKRMTMRAAWLCKCDLMTEMVGEFASLQGTMGRYYAEHSGEDSEVALAMEEIYLPRHAGDELPVTQCGRTIAIADRLDTLVGIFAIGQRPTGAKDPYGLRRAALGVLRIMIETPLDLDLEKLLMQAAENLSNKIDAVPYVQEVFDYMMERLKTYYTDQNIPADSVDAVLAQKPTRPADFNQRVLAVTTFRKMPEAETLSAANKRIRNILRKTDEKIPDKYDQNLFELDAEKILATTLTDLSKKVDPLFIEGRYTEGLQLLAGLRESVDNFFDQVMVMVDDDSIRQNRLSLLSNMENLFLQVADLSKLQ